MRKLEVLKRIVETGITAVVRAKDETEAENQRGLHCGGIFNRNNFHGRWRGKRHHSLRKKFSARN